MAHATQREFMGILARGMPKFFQGNRVLEIGSLDINGSIRDFYRNCDYIGIDIGAGKGVDVVCEGQNYAAPDGSFDHVISCEVMEHNPHWLKTFENMIRLCRPGGLVVMTCATTGRPEHGTTRTTAGDSPLTTEAGWDYYRNLTARDFEANTALGKHFAVYFLAVNWASYDLCFCGLRSGQDIPAADKSSMDSTIAAVKSYIETSNNVGISRSRKLFANLFGDAGFERMRALRGVFQGKP